MTRIMELPTEAYRRHGAERSKGDFEDPFDNCPEFHRISHILVDPYRRLDYIATTSPLDVLADIASVTTEEGPRRDLMQAGFKSDREWMQKSESDTLGMNAAVGMMNVFALLPGNPDRNDSEEDLAMMEKLYSLLREDYQTRVHAETQRLIASKYLIGTLKAIALFQTHKDSAKPLPETLINQPCAVLQNAVTDKRTLEASLETIGEDRDAVETQLKVYHTSLVHKKTHFDDIDDATLAKKLEITLRDMGDGKESVRVSDDDHNKTDFDEINDTTHANKARDKPRDIGDGKDDVSASDEEAANILRSMAVSTGKESDAEEPSEEKRGSVETAADALVNDESFAALWNQMVEMRKRYEEVQGEQGD